MSQQFHAKADGESFHFGLMVSPQGKVIELHDEQTQLGLLGLAVWSLDVIWEGGDFR